MARILQLCCMTVFIVCIALALFVAVLLVSCASFGGGANRTAQKDYAARATNFYGGKFHNAQEFKMMERNAPPDMRSISTKKTRPDFEFPTRLPDTALLKNERAPIDVCSITWFGHSSVLLQMHGMNILIDPVFSEVISPVSFVGSRRFSHPPITVDELPNIDILLLSHDHYDHLDYAVIKHIDAKVAQYIVPLGVENHLKRWKVSADKIKNMAWWEETSVNGLLIACTPAQHFSGRKLIDNMKTLWCSWVLKDEHYQIFESGDSGFNAHFSAIHDRYGDFDFALMECGQYDVQWPNVHMFPEESVQAATQLGAKLVQPIHWGAIILSRHGWDDPVERFLRAAEKDGITVITPYIGQTVQLKTPALFQERWWRSATD